MIQRHHPKPPGTWPRCGGCGGEPRLICTHGRRASDRPGAASVRWHLECPPCGTRTARYPTSHPAAAEWADTRAHRATA